MRCVGGLVIIMKNERNMGIVISYVNIGLQVIINFIYVPVLLYFIGKAEYGLYQLIGSLIAYFGVMDFGLSAAVIRFYTKYKALQDRMGMENILAISMYGYVGVTILSCILGAVCYWNLDRIFASTMTAGELAEAKAMFLLLLFNIIVTLSTMVFRAVINAHEKFLVLKGLETIQLVVQPVLVVLMLQAHPTAFSVALAQTILNTLLSLARMYYSFHALQIRIRFHYWDNDLFRDFRRLALSVFVVTVIDQVFFKTNQIILGIIDGTAAVAVYAIASLIYMNYMALSTAISSVYLPHITEMIAKKESVERLSALFIQIGRWQYYLLALVTTGFIIFGQQFIAIWAGSGFEAAYGMTLLIIIPFTIDLIQNIGLSILQAQNQYAFRARVYFFMGLFNLCLAIPLGLRFGGMGCAAATGLSMFIGNGLIMNWFYATQIHLAIGQFWKEIGKITIPVVSCLLLGYMANTLLSSTSIGVFGCKMIGYVVLYGAVMYQFAMNSDEKCKLTRRTK